MYVRTNMTPQKLLSVPSFSRASALMTNVLCHTSWTKIACQYACTFYVVFVVATLVYTPMCESVRTQAFAQSLLRATALLEYDALCCTCMSVHIFTQQENVPTGSSVNWHMSSTISTDSNRMNFLHFHQARNSDLLDELMPSKRRKKSPQTRL